MSCTATVNTNTTLKKNRVQCPGMTGERCYTEVLAQTCGISQCTQIAGMGVCYFVVL